MLDVTEAFKQLPEEKKQRRARTHHNQSGDLETQAFQWLIASASLTPRLRRRYIKLAVYAFMFTALIYK